jgi:hypothetical protein
LHQEKLKFNPTYISPSPLPEAKFHPINPPALRYPANFSALGQGLVFKYSSNLLTNKNLREQTLLPRNSGKRESYLLIVYYSKNDNDNKYNQSEHLILEGEKRHCLKAKEI